MSRFDLLQEIVWGNASPEERLRVARMVFRGAVVVLFGWSFGVLSPFGIVGFARSDEVDSKVQAAVEPLRSEIGKIAAAQVAQDTVLKAIRVDQIATKLRELKRGFCASAGNLEMSERMEMEVETAQREYRTYTGERYPLPGCGQ